MHNGANTLEHDDGVRVEDMFRRSAFNFAFATKRLVESSMALGRNTKVPHAALEDIEHARDLLNSMFMPAASKIPAAYADRPTSLTVEEVQKSVAGVIGRVEVAPCRCTGSGLADRGRVQDGVMGASVVVPIRSPRKPTKPKNRHLPDLSAPIWPKNGKALWAGLDCPACPSVAGQRCQSEAAPGKFIEKPHPQRIPIPPTDS